VKLLQAKLVHPWSGIYVISLKGKEVRVYQTNQVWVLEVAHSKSNYKLVNLKNYSYAFKDLPWSIGVNINGVCMGLDIGDITTPGDGGTGIIGAGD
jgi:hypothetical protein